MHALFVFSDTFVFSLLRAEPCISVPLSNGTTQSASRVRVCVCACANICLELETKTAAGGTTAAAELQVRICFSTFLRQIKKKKRKGNFLVLLLLLLEAKAMPTCLTEQLLNVVMNGYYWRN